MIFIFYIVKIFIFISITYYRDWEVKFRYILREMTDRLAKETSGIVENLVIHGDPLLRIKSLLAEDMYYSMGHFKMPT